MVLNAAVQMLREAEELKQNILKFKSDTSMLQERSLWSLQQQLQKIYQKVLVLDLDYALDKKVEQDLWNVGFKQQIEALQAISKDRKNPLRSDGQAMLSWVLQAAAGFYLCLLHQICTTFKLDLPFRRRASLLGWVEGWSPGPSIEAPLPPPAAARYICQHCLVHLGDIARYRQQPRVAYTFYRHALVVSPHSGQPYNQLALLARRRGRRLGALYWHVRAILVRAPFPPAPHNLARTLEALAGGVPAPPPVLLGARSRSVPAPPPAPRDAHGYVTALVRALHDIHAGERLESAEQLVDTLNTSLTSLVATDSFESMTLIKMMCVIIWLVHTTTDELTASESSLSDSEASAAALSQTLAAGAMLALLLTSHTADTPPSRALPALKVCLQWAVLYPQLLGSAPFAARPQLWHALAQALNKLPRDGKDKCESVPLPEDEELHGFQPLERSFEELKFCNHAAWDTYGRRVPDIDQENSLDQDDPPPSVVSPDCLSSDPELEASVRAHRLVRLGMRLAELMPEHFSYTTDEDDTPSFSALCHGDEQLTQCVDAARAPPPVVISEADFREKALCHGGEQLTQGVDAARAPPPVVIKEADFREKVRDQRVGILKPQGSLERAREERAMATTEDQVLEEGVAFRGEEGRCDDKREARRSRVNIAMAAILRKQEESCKQVKFKTPTPVAESTDTDATQDAAAADADASLLDRPKPSMSKPQKSLSQIPIGRKTGGILALKDKSGYPHLVEISPDTTKRKEEKPPEKDPKVIQPPSQKNQGKWTQQPVDHNRASQRNYGLQSVGISYNPNYTSLQSGNMKIRLPVVNPKEIDVRSAALQKQNSRAEYSQRAPGYMSSDKKQFLSDLPPRFANQRWARENEENKFRDEFRIQSLNPNLNTNMFNTPPPNWHGMPPPLPQLPAQLASLQSPLTSFSQMGIGSPRPAQLGQMTHPTTQITQYPPPLPLSDFVPQWWKSSMPFNPPTSNANMTQQYYPQMSVPGPSYSQIPSQTQNKPETAQSFMRPSAIGQMPTRHISPPGYNALGYAYQNIFDQYSNPPLQQTRSFLGENYPPLDIRRHVPLDLSDATTTTPFDPGYERGLDRKDDALESTPSPLDLTMSTEESVPVGRESPAEDPGTYSLFSGAPGAVTWSNVTQNEQYPWSNQYIRPPAPGPGAVRKQ